MAMAHPVEADGEEKLEFKWGKKRGVGGKKKEVQFYESFTYDGVDYVIHDCAYLYKTGDNDPHIGKIIKIWENADKTKRVKILWFFHPYELSHWLKDETTLENELILASGEGQGLANINPLEAIAGKCNIVCISKDDRNPQPSQEELQTADFVFYRTFDVGKCVILDKIEDKIAGIDVKSIFNKGECQKSNGVPKLDSDRKEYSAVALENNEKAVLFKQNPIQEHETVMTDNNCRDTLAKDVVAKSSLVRPECSPVDIHAHDASAKSGEVAKKVEKERVSEGKTTPRSKVVSDKGGDKNFKDLGNKVEVAEKAKSLKNSGELESILEGKIAQRSKVVSDKGQGKICKVLANKVEDAEKVKPLKDSSELESVLEGKITPRSKVFDKDEGKNFKVLGNKVEVAEKVKSLKDSGELESVLEGKTTSRSKIDPDKGEGKASKVIGNQVVEKLKSLKDPGELDSRPNKKAKVDSSEVSKDKKLNTAQKSKHESDGNDVKALPVLTASEEKPKFKVPKDSVGMDKGLPKKLKSDEKITKLSNGKLLKASAGQPIDDDSKIGSKVMVVSRRPDADRSKWFRGLPWEERMQAAYKQGTLVLLENLDPTYTSAEVEDIVWHGLKESCTAKMIQRTVITSPHSGQAFVILRTREAAEKVVKKLDEGCLMLSNGRALVGSFATSCIPRKEPTLVGHLVIDRLKHQMQREMKHAVSTSHCSQPNTIEYEMAMEWCLLQEKSDEWWKKLYKRQGEELRKLKAEIKSE